LSGAKASPCRERITHTSQSQGARKIIPAAGRHNQHRQFKLHQLTQVPVDRAIASKEHHDVRLIHAARHPDTPFDGFIRLEGP
jgi:hypothetical protein